jgi:DNA invertase Pin-like site-specific DNA recombinase
MEPVTVKAYSYFRFSSAVQASGDSLRRQLKAAMDWAADHPDIVLDTTLRDLGVSAYRGQNRVKGALASFLRRVESGDIPVGSYLLVESFDRLSRESETQAVNLLTSITLAGIKVVTLADGATYDDSSDAMDLMRAIIVMSRAHEENRSRGRKVAAAWADKKNRARESGEVLSRRGPGWTRYNEATGRFDLVSERALIVRRIFEEAADGLGSTAIAARLNRSNVPPFGKADGWHAHYVLSVLHNQSCIGFYQPTNWSRGGDGRVRRSPSGDPIPDYYPSAVPTELFNRVQGVISARNRRGKGRGRRGKTFPNLLQGLARCEACGGGMGIHQAGRRSSATVLRCHAAVRSHGCSNKTRYPYSGERGVEMKLWDFMLAAKEAEFRETPDTSALTGKLDARAELLRVIERLIDEVERGTPFVVDRLRTRQIELVELDREIADLRDQVRTNRELTDDDLEAAFSELWREMTKTEGDELYRVRAKMNAALVGRFDAITPLPDAIYASEGSRRWVLYDDGFMDWNYDEEVPMTPREALAEAKRRNEDRWRAL